MTIFTKLKSLKKVEVNPFGVHLMSQLPAAVLRNISKLDQSINLQQIRCTENFHRPVNNFVAPHLMLYSQFHRVCMHRMTFKTGAISIYGQWHVPQIDVAGSSDALIVHSLNWFFYVRFSCCRGVEIRLWNLYGRFFFLLRRTILSTK